MNFSFKIDSITLDPDPNWAKILDPGPTSMYLDPQHWFADSILDPNASILDPDSEFRHYLNPDQDPFINLEENV